MEPASSICLSCPAAGRPGRTAPQLQKGQETFSPFPNVLFLLPELAWCHVKYRRAPSQRWFGGMGVPSESLVL